VAPPSNRRTWINAATSAVDSGENLGEVNLAALLAKSGASKGSFYSNFPGGLPDLHEEVIAWWKAKRVPEGLDVAVNAVESPLEKLRILRSLLAGNAVRDEAMRRWAAKSAEVAAAVSDADHTIASYALNALVSLGHEGTEAEDLAEVITAVIQTIRPRAYETLLRNLAPTATAAEPHRLKPSPAEITSGNAPGELLLYALSSNLDQAARTQLRANARQLAAALSGADSPGSADEG